MNKGKRNNKGLTEYEIFKKHEPEYIESEWYNRTGKKQKKRKDWIGWVVAIVVLSTSIYFVIDHMLVTREAVYDSAQIARLSAREAVEQLFDRDAEDNLTYIRRDLTQEEYTQVEAMVGDVPESAEKVEINILLRSAGEQLESQLKALSLIEGLKTPSGEPNVDLKDIDILLDMERFPTNYNPEYAQELTHEYTRLASLISQAIDLQARIRELAVNGEVLLDKEEIDSLNEQVEALPFSDRKSQLTHDMKALYQAYDRQVVELEEQRIAEEQRLAEQERYRQEQEEIRRREAEIREEEERIKQERIAEEQAEQRRLQEEQDRIMRQEQERLEQERQEQERLEQERLEQERQEQERLEQERLEQERLEQERLEQERLEQERLEQERLEQERLEQERLEQERLEQERQQQEQEEQDNNNN